LANQTVNTLWLAKDSETRKRQYSAIAAALVGGTLIRDRGFSTARSVTASIYDAMVKAIARAFRWREQLENGTHSTIAEIAAAEKINESYVGRVLRLTLLAPDIVDAILTGRQPAEMTLAVLMRGESSEQRS
jgi:hypothetical protein